MIVGFAVVTPCAAYVLAHVQPRNQDEVMFPWFIPLLFAVGLGIPVGTWVLLWLTRMKDTLLIVLVAYTVTLFASAVVQQTLLGSRGPGPAWMYGLCGAVAYGATAFGLGGRAEMRSL